MLQACEEPAVPGQLAPPYCGAGFEHVRDRVCVPPPHVTVHVPQLVHVAHAPSTEKRMIMR